MKKLQQFSYKASDKTGKLVKGNIEAEDEQSVIIKLQEMHFLPIQVTNSPAKKNYSLDLPFSSSFFKRVSAHEVMVFTQQLAILLNAGVPLDKALSILIELTEKKNLKAIAADIKKNVHSGISLADALAKHPQAFSRLYTNMVTAGEAGGVLETILDRLSTFLENAQQLKESVLSAMIYPVILTAVGGAAITVLLTFVVPKFTKIFMDMGQVVPLSTRILLNLSDFLRNYYLLLLIGAVVLFAGIHLLLKIQKMRIVWDGLKLKIPLLGDLIKKIEVSRFSRTFGTLLKSGVPILKSLLIIRDTLTNTHMALSMEILHKRVQRGGGIAEPLKKTNIFPAMAVHMVAVGEETGQLDEMLIKIADTYDKEVQVAVKRVVALIEPVMILIMGVTVGFIVISMLMAIFSVNDLPF